MANASLPLRELLGIPLAAAIEAESIAAEASVAFIRQVGFTGGKPNGDDLGEVRYVTFRFDVEEPGPTKATRRVRVPLLALLPIPLMQLTRSEFEFDVHVDDVTERPEKDGPGPSPQLRAREATRLELLGRFGAGGGARPQEGPVLRVKLEVGPSDLPAGLAVLLRALDRATGEPPRDK